MLPCHSIVFYNVITSGLHSIVLCLGQYLLNQYPILDIKFISYFSLIKYAVVEILYS